MFPTSGRNGYLSWGGAEVPIYSWNISAINNRTNLILSNSQGFPVRHSGPTTEIISIHGVEYAPAMLLSATTLTTMTFDIGFMDFTTLLFRKVPIEAMLVELNFNLKYSAGSQPSFSWTANFIGCMTDKEYTVENLIINDKFVCQTSLCDNSIVTTDNTLNTGFVRYVRTATVTRSYLRPNLVLSNSNNHLAETIGTFDTIVNMSVEGDFDYWLEELNTNNRYNYGFFYDIGSAIAANNMKVMSTTDHIANIQTAELLSMSVQLGASYE